MNNIQHIFFDLDHTLWDFEENSRNTLLSIISEQFPDFSSQQKMCFFEIYQKNNQMLWELYHQHKISKDELRLRRFSDTFTQIQVSQDPEIWSDLYLGRMPLQNQLLPETIETLDYLQHKYSMSLITNGFAEVQRRKTHLSGIGKYFKEIFISEEIGFQKPHPDIFIHALQEMGVAANASVMVGDNFITDVKGGADAGLHAVWFNPAQLAVPDPETLHVEIQTLSELKQWL